MPHPAMSKAFRDAPQPSDNNYVYYGFVIPCVLILIGMIVIFSLGI
jgi:hypothetical protein